MTDMPGTSFTCWKLRAMPSRAARCGVPAVRMSSSMRTISARDEQSWVDELAPDQMADPVGHAAFVHAHPRWIAQAFADALGAKVYQNEEKEIGWFPIRLRSESAGLFGGGTSELEVFHWHGDTFDLPSGAVWIAAVPSDRSEVSGNLPNSVMPTPVMLTSRTGAPRMDVGWLANPRLAQY